MLWSGVCVLNNKSNVFISVPYGYIQCVSFAIEVGGNGNNTCAGIGSFSQPAVL